MDYYRDIITQQSWAALQSLVQEHSFVLIGGWAVWLWTKRLKSKDIDIVIDFTQLSKLKQKYPLTKNDRLKKYEIVDRSVSIDIYVPHWSIVGIPAEDLLPMAVPREGFRVAPPEALLITKQIAYQSRAGSSKGRKDLVDIISLLLLDDFNWQSYHNITKKYDPTLSHTLSLLLASHTSMPEIDLNPHVFAKLKRRWLKNLKE